MDNITVTWRCKQCGTANDSRSCECEECGSDRTTGGSGSKLRSLIGTAHINSHTGPNQGVIFNQPQIVVNPPPEPEVLKPKEPSQVWRGFKGTMFWAWIGSVIAALFSFQVHAQNDATQFMQIFVYGLLGACIGSCVGFLYLQVTDFWKANKVLGFISFICLVTTAIPTVQWFLTSPSVQEAIIDRGPLAIMFAVSMLLFAYCFVSYIVMLILFGVACMIDRS